MCTEQNSRHCLTKPESLITRMQSSVSEGYNEVANQCPSYFTFRLTSYLQKCLDI